MVTVGNCLNLGYTFSFKKYWILKLQLSVHTAWRPLFFSGGVCRLWLMIEVNQEPLLSSGLELIAVAICHIPHRCTVVHVGIKNQKHPNKRVFEVNPTPFEYFRSNFDNKTHIEMFLYKKLWILKTVFEEFLNSWHSKVIYKKYSKPNTFNTHLLSDVYYGGL